jgi:streptogramin lyase
MRLFAAGDDVAGYRIEALVGRGGMGVVYRAREAGLDRAVALKVIAPELVEDGAVRRRFIDEARAAARIEHPHVIPVHAAGERDGVAFIAMRFVDGDDLRGLVRREGPLDPALAAQLTADAGAALDAIHRGGFVHRDVKPGNLLRDTSGHLYLTDFGLAKEVLASRGATRSGQWVGTLDYVAPEQIRGGRVDARADVYALGGVLHFLLTGHVPFEHDGDEAKLWAQLSEPPPAPSRLRPGLQRRFDAVVERAMAKEPGVRYPSAGDLGRAAVAAVTGARPSEPERVVARGGASPDEAATLAEDASTRTGIRRAQPRSRRRLAVAGAAGLAAAAAAGAVALLGGGGDAPSHRASARRSTGPRVTQTISGVGQRPNGIALAGGSLWVTSFRRSDVARIDAASGKLREPTPGVGLGAGSIVADGDAVWVGEKRSNQVVRIDSASARVTRRRSVPGPPQHIAIGPSGLWIAIPAAQGDELLRYDRTGARLRDRVHVSHGINAMALSADALWVAERGVPKVARLDLRRLRLRDVARLHDVAVGLDLAAGYLWAELPGDRLVRVDMRTGVPVATVAGHTPTQVVGAGGRVYVASSADHTVLVLDPRTTDPIGKPLHVGLNPFALATDGRTVWVTSLGENAVTRIDG